MMQRFLFTVSLMRTLVIVAASALLLAAAIVEIPSRLWADSNLALLIVAAIALFLQGWLGTRIPVGAPMREKAQPRAPAKSKPAARAPAKGDGNRESGTVKWFNRSKGFGFIVRDSGEEIFVHQRSIRSSNDPDKRRPALRDGQAVTFVVIEREKGLQADDVVAA